MRLLAIAKLSLCWLQSLSQHSSEVVWVCMCSACACQRVGEKERGRQKQRDRQREIDRERAVMYTGQWERAVMYTGQCFNVWESNDWRLKFPLVIWIKCYVMLLLFYFTSVNGVRVLSVAVYVWSSLICSFGKTWIDWCFGSGKTSCGRRSLSADSFVTSRTVYMTDQFVTWITVYTDQFVT